MKTVRTSWWFLLALMTVIADASAARAQESPGFGDMPRREIVAAPFSDGQVAALIGTLDSLLQHQTTASRWRSDATLHLSNFVERLQTGRLQAAQQTRVLDYLEGIARQHPQDADVVEAQRHVVSTLMVGEPAPDIVGKDLDGKELRLSDYRGRIVVLAFSGEWCGACRAEYPYQRMLLELYKDRPLTVLSVDSDDDPQVVKKVRAQQGLTFRSWWDGGAPEGVDGPIASAWGVSGWPTVYVLDETGVIRFVNLRQEDLLKGVKQLMSELASKPRMAATVTVTASSTP